MEPRSLLVSFALCIILVIMYDFFSSISSHFHEPIRFKVRDKEHTLGSVSVPIAGLTGSPNKQWLPLQPHKRSSDAHGSVLVGCWVPGSGEMALKSTHGTFGVGFLSRPHSNRHSMYDPSTGDQEIKLRSFQSDTNVRDTGVEDKVC